MTDSQSKVGKLVKPYTKALAGGQTTIFETKFQLYGDSNTRIITTNDLLVVVECPIKHIFVVYDINHGQYCWVYENEVQDME